MLVYSVYEYVPYEGEWIYRTYRDLHDALIAWQQCIADDIERVIHKEYDESELLGVRLSWGDSLVYDTIREALDDSQRQFNSHWELRVIEVH